MGLSESSVHSWSQGRALEHKIHPLRLQTALLHSLLFFHDSSQAKMFSSLWSCIKNNGSKSHGKAYTSVGW